MALTVNPSPTERIDAAELGEWRDLPTAIISDELNRTATMHAAIRPLRDGYRFAAQALTVQAMVGDNAPLHYALTVAWPECALIVDGRGHADTALWGGILAEAAIARGVVAVVIDGAVRDAAELRRSNLAVYARGIVPNGPHKGFGGAVNVGIQCGGVSVAPGDLVVGDDDGLVVITPAQRPGLMDRCRARIAREAEMLERIAAGVSTVELIGLPPADALGR